MTGNIFGWGLPPGCSELPGEEPDMIEAFENAVELSSEEIERLDDAVVTDLLDKMFGWANRLGYERQGIDDGFANSLNNNRGE